MCARNLKPNDVGTKITGRQEYHEQSETLVDVHVVEPIVERVEQR